MADAKGKNPGLFEVNIVSPERQVFSGPVCQALIPGAEGYMGVLVGHAPVIANLQTVELLTLYETDTETPSRRFVVSGGFVEILPTRCTVLADRVLDLDAVSIEEINAALAMGEDVLFWKKIKETLRQTAT